ncbi:hypothetical protein AGABI1DRAFT_112221 [Agaricus bisporus var. burnettii JB137-S8]|uniref:DUF6534 domain-containing protein n=1 Tax=Agaricus bisporus var. burnettii (strain JB137-S8 / ATCC MYA-4627 / FGSC 10392) TaxID=597362 RepID=K5W5M6_AGABU|nr:uncharacterized protein AGABI1DRAFT_112221 [Agaricus bisporus var. burnettii JB137-S8]EKM82094.1 hypothetical protein AGABI1DRAFT_112221 [Agaricus bisporus var. burnettii JB137-S8]
MFPVQDLIMASRLALVRLYYLYYIAFPNDKKITKAIVGFVYSVGTIQTLVALHDFYKSFCVMDSSAVLFDDAVFNSFMWLTIPLSSTLVATVAQLFYAHRIYVLSRKKVVTAVVTILALAQLSFGLISTADFAHDIPGESPISGSMSAVGWGAAGMTCDLLITVYMFRFLTIQMGRSSKTTQALLTRIKRLLLETGLLTAVLATTYPLLLALVGNNTYAIPGLTLGKIYSNSILVLLNNRFTIVGGRNEPGFEFEADSYHLSELPRRESTGHGIQE